jgi:Zn-dependent protease
LVGTLMMIPGFLIGLAFHEFAHALAADKLGDPTPRQQGRLTIEPWPHIDIIGLLFLLLVGFGWAKPVQIDARNFKNPRRDDTIVALAGPLTNLFMVFLFSTIIFVLKNIKALGTIEEISYLFWILYATVWINAILFILNLLPVPPLDGSHIIANLLPSKYAQKYLKLQQFSIIILIVLMFTDTLKYIIIAPAKFIYAFGIGIFNLPDILKVIG